MANNFKRILAVTLAAATAFTCAVPAGILKTPASIVYAAENPAKTIDAKLAASMNVAPGVKTAVGITSSQDTVDGVIKEVSYEVTSSDKTIVAINQGDNADKAKATYDKDNKVAIDFEALKGGKATVTITEKDGTTVIGEQKIEVTVSVKAGLTVAQTGGALGDGAVAADATVKVYRGEAIAIATTTDTAAAQIEGVNSFSVLTSNSNVKLVTEDAKEAVGIINPTLVKKEVLAGSTYTAYFTAAELGTTEITISQAAAKDNSTQANTFKFKLEVIERDGGLSVSYDSDRDLKLEDYNADYYDGAKFTTKAAAAPKTITLDVDKNKEIQLSAQSATKQAVSFESSEPTVVTVDNSGLVKVVRKAGDAKTTANITVKTAASATSGIKASEIVVPVSVTDKELSYITLSGDVDATTVGDADNTVTVGAAIASDAAALASLRDTTDKTLVLGKGYKASFKIASNAADYLTVESGDAGKVKAVRTGNEVTLDAVAAGAATVTLTNKPGADVSGTSTIVLHVYVSEYPVTNTVYAAPVDVDAVNTKATFSAKVTGEGVLGTPVFDTKFYKQKEDGTWAVDTVAGLSINAKGEVTFVPSGVSGTTCARVAVEQDTSKKIFGTAYEYVIVNYTAKAANAIKLEKNKLTMAVGETATISVSATDPKTTFSIIDDAEVATAKLENGVITVTAVAEGTALITVKGTSGDDKYAAPETQAIAVTVTKKALVANPIKVATKTATVKAAKVKKAAVKLSVAKVISVKNAQGTVTYAKVKGDSKIVINKKTGAVTLKKGLKKGTYTVKVKVKAAGNDEYSAKTVTKSFKIKVK